MKSRKLRRPITPKYSEVSMQMMIVTTITFYTIFFLVIRDQPKIDMRKKSVDLNTENQALKTENENMMLMLEAAWGREGGRVGA